MKKVIVIIAVMLLLTGCAHEVTFEEAKAMSEAGFWSGLWHGITAPIAFIASWFSDITVYAIYNNGGWYNFGFLLGVGAFTSCPTKRNRD
jgi:hypothetical protein